jgi:glyoxylase-like metal-dependent hydrolase (beta-lactamase superfamily II)
MPDNTTRITRFGFVNAYLVREDDGLTLVDALLPRSAKVVLRAADELGAPVVRIALTHAHGDHIGSLDALAAALPGVEVLISERDERLLRKDLSLDPGEPQRKPKGSLPGAETRPTRTLTAGEMVGSLEVVAAPGHTPGHVAYLDRRDGTLFCGDAFTTLGGVATTDKVRLPFPLASMATWDPATELESARALSALQPNRLAPGHGKIVDTPVSAMDAAIAKASK